MAQFHAHSKSCLESLRGTMTGRNDVLNHSRRRRRWRRRLFFNWRLDHFSLFIFLYIIIKGEDLLMACLFLLYAIHHCTRSEQREKLFEPLIGIWIIHETKSANKKQMIKLFAHCQIVLHLHPFSINICLYFYVHLIVAATERGINRK